MELPLPNYLPFYRKVEQRLRPMDLTVCTEKDSILSNSDPKPATGCQKYLHEYTGIKQFCRTPIKVECGMTRSSARDAFYR